MLIYLEWYQIGLAHEIIENRNKLKCFLSVSEGQPRYRARARDCGIGFLSVSEGQPESHRKTSDDFQCFLSVSEGQPVRYPKKRK